MFILQTGAMKRCHLCNMMSQICSQRVWQYGRAIFVSISITNGDLFRIKANTFDPYGPALPVPWAASMHQPKHDIGDPQHAGSKRGSPTMLDVAYS
jgi:hypothetical protein